MRHGVRTQKLGMNSTHRIATMKNMAVSLILHEQIETTLPKAKSLRPFLEKLITKAIKAGSDLSTRRFLLSRLASHLAVDKLMKVIKGRYSDRNGGYLRIVKTGFRHGDCAPTAIIEFVDRDLEALGRDYGKAKNIEQFLTTSN